MSITREVAEAVLDNTKQINELLAWKDQMYGIIGGLSSSVEGLTSIIELLDKEIQELREEREE